MNTPRRWAGVFLTLLATSLSSAAHAANIFEGINIKSAAILEVNPTVRSRAMGDAGTAAFWDGTNAWANPALLGRAVGVQYESFGSDDEIYDFDVARTSLGYGGIGLSTTGRPIPGLGRIDRRFTFFYDPPPIENTESVESWSVGLSASQLASTIARAAHRAPPSITRWFDLAFGYSEKRVEESSVSTEYPTHESSAYASDLGLLVRAGAPLGPLALDLAYGYSEINFNEPKLDNVPTSRDWRNGVAARATWDDAVTRSHLPGWFEAGTHPLVSAGWAMDFVRTTGGPSDFNGWGVEVGLANVLFGRIGRQELAHTWGLGVGLPLGRYGGARWDHSSRTRGLLSDETRNGWTMWLDPLAVYGAVK